MTSPERHAPTEPPRRHGLRLLGATALAVATPATFGAPRTAADDTRVDVAVIGAGLSGLVAAHDLQAAGVHVKVFEARPRVGGRTLNQTFPDGAVVDGGAQWVGGTQTAVQDLATRLGVETVAQFLTGDLLAVAGPRRQRLPASLPPDPDTVRIQTALEALARTVPLDAPWTAPNAVALDRLTVDDWLRLQNAGPQARLSVAITVGGALSAAPQDVSLLWFAFYLHSAGGFQALDTDAQSFRLVGGAQRLSLALAERLGDRVVLNAPVTAVRDWDGDGVTVDSAAGRVRARRVIVAMMPADVQRITFDPPLPASRARLQRRWGTGTGMKVHLQYPTPFWRDRGLAGQILSGGPLIELTFDASPEDGSSGVLLAFVNGEKVPGDPLARRRAIVAEATLALGPAAARPIGYLEQNWALEAWTAGCVSPLPTRLISRDGPTLREPLGRVHWAGTETAEVWSGYMDGAVRAGQRAAREAVHQLQAAGAGPSQPTG